MKPWSEFWKCWSQKIINNFGMMKWWFFMFLVGLLWFERLSGMEFLIGFGIICGLKGYTDGQIIKLGKLNE